MTSRHATVVVIGGGQSGLSAGYHLKRRGFASAQTDPTGERTFVVLDAAPAPGGAWQDVILWATGFQAALAHLEPLGCATRSAASG
jgi:cation diffusion facilitator CzcD-associated flavoprotein CzcO